MRISKTNRSWMHRLQLDFMLGLCYRLDLTAAIWRRPATFITLWNASSWMVIIAQISNHHCLPMWSFLSLSFLTLSVSFSSVYVLVSVLFLFCCIFYSLQSSLISHRHANKMSNFNNKYMRDTLIECSAQANKGSANRGNATVSLHRLYSPISHVSGK